MEKKPIELICTQEISPETRLDKFLSEKFPAFSRTYFHNLISEGLVIVNKKVVTRPSYILKENDHVILLQEPCHFAVEPMPIALDIIDETNDFLIINKPAGLLVHQSPSSSTEGSLVNGLLYRFPEFNQFADKIRAGIVHRLDKNTSGLIIVAKNPRTEEKFKELFKKRQVQKTYQAVIVGHLPKQGRIDSPIGRDLENPLKMTTKSIYGKPSLTTYTSLSYFEKDGVTRTLVLVKPETGRTHQIRVHFASIGHPLEGDVVYGSPSPLITRHALHASEIEFIFEGKKYHYKQPFPPDFKHLLDSLGDIEKLKQ